MVKFILLNILLSLMGCSLQQNQVPVPASERISGYLPALEGKTVGIMANQSSLVSGVHLIDTLLALGVNIDRIFSVEHGLRGTEDDGKLVSDGIDSVSMLPVISLYGSKRKPEKNDLNGLDLVIYDIQDVGVRCYTYISSLQLLMEGCSENGVGVLILDRPNPNGFYVDGPVLDTAFSSFIGMQPIPFIYGMTIGEYATMINQEGMLSGGLKCDLQVVRCSGYNHASRYSLPVRPSPNLPNDTAVELYPSLTFFEGTVISVGRGTYWPFQVIGHPDLPETGFTFVPHPVKGSAHPPLEGEICNGIDLRNPYETGFTPGRINLSYLIEAYSGFPDKGKFFRPYFELLAGGEMLRQQIIAGIPEEEIRASWKPALDSFKKIRSKYLLYPDY